MKQVVQNIRTGDTNIAQVPAAIAAPGHVVIANHTSMISAGTEKMLMDLGKKSFKLGSSLLLNSTCW